MRHGKAKRRSCPLTLSILHCNVICVKNRGVNFLQFDIDSAEGAKTVHSDFEGKNQHFFSCPSPYLTINILFNFIAV